MKTLILLLLLVSFPVQADWIGSTTQIAALTALYADWHTTREMGKYYNTPNPKNGLTHNEQGMFGLFGETPSQGEINSYFAAWAIINLSINKYGNRTIKSFFNTWQFSVHYTAYKHNVSIGLSSAF